MIRVGAFLCKKMGNKLSNLFPYGFALPQLLFQKLQAFFHKSAEFRTFQHALV